MFYEGCTIDEIRAYRDLEGEVFDFGEGKMKIDGWYGSEDAYYEMCLPEESGYNAEIKEYYHHKSKIKHRVRYRLNPYTRKQICKYKLDKLYSEGSWWTVWDKNTHKVRCYISPRAKHHKKYSNKKVRKTQNIGSYNSYKKVYDFWWEVW